MKLTKVFILKEVFSENHEDDDLNFKFRRSPLSKIEHNTIEAIKKIILSVCEPEKIVLFGSRARNNFRDDSDFDIFIVADKKEEGDEETLQFVNQMLEKAGIYSDCFIAYENETVPQDYDFDQNENGFDTDNFPFYGYILNTFPTREIYNAHEPT